MADLVQLQFHALCPRCGHGGIFDDTPNFCIKCGKELIENKDFKKVPSSTGVQTSNSGSSDFSTQTSATPAIAQSLTTSAIPVSSHQSLVTSTATSSHGTVSSSQSHIPVSDQTPITRNQALVTGNQNPVTGDQNLGTGSQALVSDNQKSHALVSMCTFLHVMQKSVIIDSSLKPICYYR